MEAEVSCTPSTPPNPDPKPERAKLALSSSPPPNCAICLSDCDNKSFTDKCLHQFCFACLLRWSKVKAECPLCKQPFKSIIHTVRSLSDYEELSVYAPPTQAEEFHEHESISVDFEQPHRFRALPTIPPAPRQRRFQYRTTLYLDPHEDIAIQQMLMAHPLTNTLYMPRRRLTRLIGTNRTTNSLDFRHAIYQHNWWVDPRSTIDSTGRSRDCTPIFFRTNPAQRLRIAPWLHRELSALLNDNAPHCMYVMAVIHDLLVEHHVLSTQFKDRIQPYFNDKTDHFIHEFYNFLRSPYDMVGYDRQLQYNQRVHELGSSSSTEIGESDVEVVSEIPAPINQRILTTPGEVINVSDTDSTNSDVVIREPTPPPLVTISDSDDDDDAVVFVESSNPVAYKKEEVSESESDSVVFVNKTESRKRRSMARRIPLKKRFVQLPEVDSDSPAYKRARRNSTSSSSEARSKKTIVRRKKRLVKRKLLTSSSSSSDSNDAPSSYRSGEPSTSSSYNRTEVKCESLDSDDLPLSVLPGCSKYLSVNKTRPTDSTDSSDSLDSE